MLLHEDQMNKTHSNALNLFDPDPRFIYQSISNHPHEQISVLQVTYIYIYTYCTVQVHVNKKPCVLPKNNRSPL